MSEKIKLKRYPVPDNWSVETYFKNARVVETFNSKTIIDLHRTGYLLDAGLVPKYLFISIHFTNVLVIKNFKICPNENGENHESRT